ncbi:hypothetical protein [uncultured Roseobacter sp.]|uniref:hypothetical protein n=1 Tax=uncultured Roseobacter sp. TaxID=114847 RepID=UPI002621003F|nr:hypothetical protein [uncultured Roseobacter sp.]
MAKKDTQPAAGKSGKKKSVKATETKPKNDEKPGSYDPPAQAKTSPLNSLTGASRVVPVLRPNTAEIITITSHRELAVRSKDIEARVAESPEFSVMFLANPVLALEAYGIKLSRELQHHVLSSLRHPPVLRKRREALEARLEEELGETAQPTTPEWMANLVFEIRKMEPRQIGKREPAYRAPLNAASIERLQKARPKGASRYGSDKRLPVRFTLQLEKPRSAIRRMDLDADVPALKKATRKPARLSVEEAWFYKDDPIVRDAVELGQIMQRGFPFRTPAEFRKLEAAETVDGFRRFIRNVRVKQVKAR